MNSSYLSSSTETGFTVIRPNEVFAHIDVMAREIYGADPDFANVLLALGIQFLPSLSELRLAHPGLRPIGYQFEQLYSGAESVDQNLLEWVESGCELWDYDLDNMSFVSELTGAAPRFRPLLYARGLQRLENRRRPKIDVLFYGSRNTRREALLDRIKSCNRRIRLRWAHGWGGELDSHIENSKIVINLHYYESAIQEQSRIFYLLTNGKCVLSETSARNYYGDLIVEADSDTLPEAAAYLLKDDRWKTHASEAAHGFRAWSERMRSEGMVRPP